IRAQVPAIAKAALLKCQASLKPQAGEDGAAIDVNAFWALAGASTASTQVTLQGNLNSTRTTRAAQWHALVVDYLQRLAQSALTTAGAPSGDPAEAQALLAVSLMRLRRLRLSLAAQLQT